MYVNVIKQSTYRLPLIRLEKEDKEVSIAEATAVGLKERNRQKCTHLPGKYLTLRKCCKNYIL